jgi:enoyl-[acyl-carrier protein] reductase I
MMMAAGATYRSAGSAASKVVLIMGIANQHSIAWSCLERFLLKSGTDNEWNIIYTVQTEKNRSKVQSMIEKRLLLSNNHNDNNHNNNIKERILGGYVCDVTQPSSMESFFREALPEVLYDKHDMLSIQAVVHSLAYAPNLRTPLLQTTKQDFLEAHEVSSYSLIQVSKEVLPHVQQGSSGGSSSSSSSSSSITTLSYLGSERAIPGYNVMGPAKASLESVVRGLALELGGFNIRVNAVRAGPVPTISSKGGIAGFDVMRNDVQQRAPLGNISASQVADTVYHVAADASGMTGQIIDVDGGYSIVAGPPATAI